MTSIIQLSQTRWHLGIDIWHRQYLPISTSPAAETTKSMAKARDPFVLCQKCWPDNTIFANRFDCLQSWWDQGSNLCTAPHLSFFPHLLFCFSLDTSLLLSLYKLAIVINALLLVPSCFDLIRQGDRSSPHERNKYYYYKGMKTTLFLGCRYHIVIVFLGEPEKVDKVLKLPISYKL